MNKAKQVAIKLLEKNIPFKTKVRDGGYQIFYPDSNNDIEFVCSVIDHSFSYGLEIMGLLTDEEREHDSVAGYMKVDDVANRIEEHYKTLKEKKC